MRRTVLLSKIIINRYLGVRVMLFDKTWTQREIKILFFKFIIPQKPVQKSPIQSHPLVANISFTSFYIQTYYNFYFYSCPALCFE